LAIQDDVTNLQEFCVKYSAKKRAGIEIDVDLVTESMRSRQNIWKRLARIDSEELWDLCSRLIAAEGMLTRAQTVPELDSAMNVIGNAGADIQQTRGEATWRNRQTTLYGRVAAQR
jgi:hypothetical protein